MKKFITFLLLSTFTVSHTALASFSDTNAYTYKDSVHYLQDTGIVNGYEDGTFKPNNNVNRAEFMKMVMEGFYDISDDYNKDCFTDIKAGAWYAKYVCMGKALKIVDGRPDGSFDPAAQITQPEALKIIFNALKQTVTNNGGEWYQQYLDHAEQIGMYYFNTSSPAAYNVTRGETSYFIAWLTSPKWINQISSQSFYTGKDAYFDFHEEELGVE